MFVDVDDDRFSLQTLIKHVTLLKAHLKKKKARQKTNINK